MPQIDDNSVTKDDLIMQVVANSPGLSKRAIGRKCKDLGLIGHENVIFKTLRRTELLAETLPNVKHYHKEYLSREVTPIALKELKDTIKDKELSRKDKLPAIKIALDKEFGEDRAPIRQVDTYNIAEIKILVAQGLGDDKAAEILHIA